VNRIVNVTLDKNIRDDGIVDNEKHELEAKSEAWMKSYNKRRFEAKVFKLKQGLSLVL